MGEPYLKHFGIKGMKWGVRRFQNKDGTLTAAGKKRKAQGDDSPGSEVKKSSETSSSQPKKKSVKEMTDAELKEKISRLELEKRYRDLSPKEVNKGKDFVMKVLEQSGKNIATQFATYAMGTAVNKAFENIFNDPAVVNPKKGQKDK